MFPYRYGQQRQRRGAATSIHSNHQKSLIGQPHLNDAVEHSNAHCVLHLCVFVHACLCVVHVCVECMLFGCVDVRASLDLDHQIKRPHRKLSSTFMQWEGLYTSGAHTAWFTVHQTAWFNLHQTWKRTAHNHDVFLHAMRGAVHKRCPCIA